MQYLDAAEVHGVISPTLNNKIASNSSFNDVSMSPQLLH